MSGEWGSRLDGNIVRGAFGSRAPALVVDLRRRDVPVAEEGLDFGDINAGVKKQGGGGGSKRMWSIDASARSSSFRNVNLLH